MKKIKKYTIVFSISMLLFISIINPFSLKATITNATHYDIEIEQNVLIYTFPDYQYNYDKEFIGINGVGVVYRENNTLLIDGQPIEPISAYQYVWAWYFETTSQGVDDFAIRITIYNLNVNDFLDSNFNYVDTYVYEVSTFDNNILNIDYDSTLETFTNFLSFDSSQLKVYLLQNGLQQDYSALGKIINVYYNDGVNTGYQQGINEQLARQNWWVELWNGVDAFLSVELLPNLTFGLLFSVPLVFGVLHLILFIWRSGD